MPMTTTNGARGNPGRRRGKQSIGSLTDNPLASSGQSQMSGSPTGPNGVGTLAPSCPLGAFNPSGRCLFAGGFEYPLMRWNLSEMSSYCSGWHELEDAELRAVFAHRFLRMVALCRASQTAARRLTRNGDVTNDDREIMTGTFIEMQLFCRCLLPTMMNTACYRMSAKMRSTLASVRSVLANAVWQRTVDVSRWSPATSVHSDFRSDFDDPDQEFDKDFTSIDSRIVVAAPPDLPSLTANHILSSSTVACRALEETVPVMAKAKASLDKHHIDLSVSHRRKLRRIYARHSTALTLVSAIVILLLVGVGVWSLVAPGMFSAYVIAIIAFALTPLLVLFACGSFLSTADQPPPTDNSSVEEIFAALVPTGVGGDDAELRILLSTVAQLGPTLCVPVPRIAWEVLSSQAYPVDRLDALLLPVNGTVLFPKLGETVFNRAGGSRYDLNDLTRNNSMPPPSEPYVVPHPTIAMMLTLKSGEIVYVTESLCDFFVDATPDNFLRRKIGDVLFLDQWNDESGAPILCKRIDEVKPLDPTLQLHPDVYSTDAMVTPLFGMLQARDPNAEGPADEVIDLDSGIQVPFIGTTLSFYIHRRVAMKEGALAFDTHVQSRPSVPITLPEVRGSAPPSSAPTDSSVATAPPSRSSADHLGWRNHVLTCLGKTYSRPRVDIPNFLVSAPTHGGRREKVGKGGFSIVYKLAIGDHAHRTDIIVKSIPLYGAADEQRRDPKLSSSEYRALLIKDRTSEFEVDPENMLLLDHPNLVHLYHSEVIYNPPELRLDVYQEFCEGKTLKEVLTGGLPSGHDVVDIVRSVLQALAHLHRNRIAHRDVKPDNVMIRGGCYKLGDFGTAILLVDGEGEPETRGTLEYMAPEIQLNERYTTAADIYSFGCLMLDLLGLKPLHINGGPAGAIELFRRMKKNEVVPFGRADQPQQQDASDLFNESTKELLQMIKLCLIRNPDDRPRAEMLLKFPLLLDRHKMAQQVEIVSEQHRRGRGRSGLHSSFNFSVDSKIKPPAALPKPPTPGFPTKGMQSPKMTPKVGFQPLPVPIELANDQRPPSFDMVGDPPLSHAPFVVPTQNLGFALYTSTSPAELSH